MVTRGCHRQKKGAVPLPRRRSALLAIGVSTPRLSLSVGASIDADMLAGITDLILPTVVVGITTEERDPVRGHQVLADLGPSGVQPALADRRVATCRSQVLAGDTARCSGWGVRNRSGAGQAADAGVSIADLPRRAVGSRLARGKTTLAGGIDHVVASLHGGFIQQTLADAGIAAGGTQVLVGGVGFLALCQRQPLPGNWCGRRRQLSRRGGHGEERGEAAIPVPPQMPRQAVEVQRVNGCFLSADRLSRDSALTRESWTHRAFRRLDTRGREDACPTRGDRDHRRLRRESTVTKHASSGNGSGDQFPGPRCTI